MTDTITLRLKAPIEYGGQTYEQIDLSEPTAGQMEKAAGGTNGQAIVNLLISEVAKIPLGAVRLMKKRDIEAAASFLAGFTIDVRESGSAF